MSGTNMIGVCSVGQYAHAALSVLNQALSRRPLHVAASLRLGRV